MNNVFLMNSLESSQDLHKNIQGLVEFKHLLGHSVLIRIQISVLTVLHNKKNGLCLYIDMFLQANVLSNLTILGCLSEYIELIS